jgi:lipopolysaccharide export system protein LptA
MPLHAKRLSKLFAAGAVLIVLIVAAVYIHGIWKSRSDVPPPSKPIPSNMQSRATGFSFSKSEGGKTLFTIHAASVQQFKEGGRAALHDVSIIIYGRNQDRSDQIYGSDFAYDPVAKVVTAEGEVRIDLEANSASVAPGQAPAPETRNLIHVKTSGLTFSENTGIAQTSAPIEFRVPEANGSAVGATYDSHGGVLTLKSAVKIATTGKRKATINSQSAAITKNPSKIVLQSARVEEPERTISADRVTVFMRDDNNNVDRVEASGNLRAIKTGTKAFEITAPAGELRMADANQARSGLLSGGVTFLSKSDSPAQGKAGKILLTFAEGNRLAKARAEDAVQLRQGPAGKSQEIHAAAIDLFVKDGRKLEKAVTSAAPAEIVFDKSGEKTTITAGRFETTFNDQNRPVSLYGTPDTKIIDSAPGKQDRVLTARELRAKFNDKGEIASAEQTGDFHYQEGTQTASAEHADYRAADETIVLAGSPRVVDAAGTLTAETIQLNRKTRNAVAEKNVKTTYTGQKAQPNGAMLAGSDPVHVTGAAVTVNQGTGVARYTQARLWQGANIVEAPVISFDRAHRSLVAQGSQSGQVASVFVQKDKQGKLTPVNVTSDKLSYVDSERKAVFSGKVLVRAQETTITAESVQVLLLPKGGQPENQGASQLERIVAQGDIHIEQGGRRATGSQLVYTAAEEKMVLTGTPEHRPSIFDAERGEILGDSLTFFTHDGRVLVGSGETSQTQIPTRIRDASKK